MGGSVEKVIYTVEHELGTTAGALALYDVLPSEVRRQIEMQVPEFREIMKRAGERHDFEKREWPEDLLCKKRNPTEEDWEVWIRPHPIKSAESYFEMYKDPIGKRMIRHHHERWDGFTGKPYGGYPGELKGEDIPFGARIMKIADAFHAMVSNRPYRDRKFNILEALGQIRERAGTEYDPNLAPLFCSISVSILEKIAGNGECGKAKDAS